LINETNEAGRDQYCTAAAYNYNHERMDLLEIFDNQSEEYLKWFR
jgi:hypothetical protein